MTANQLAYWGNKIKEQEAEIKAKDAETKRKEALTKQAEAHTHAQQYGLDMSKHLHEYGSLIKNEKHRDIGSTQFKDLTQGVRNIFGAAGDIIGPIAKALSH